MNTGISVGKKTIQIRKGDVYVGEWGVSKEVLKVLDVAKNGADQIVKTQHGWEDLSKFVSRNPLKIGTLKFYWFGLHRVIRD